MVVKTIPLLAVPPEGVTCEIEYDDADMMVNAVLITNPGGIPVEVRIENLDILQKYTGTSDRVEVPVARRDKYQLKYDPSPILHYDMEALTPDNRMKDLAPPGSHGVITGTELIPGGRRFPNPGNAVTHFIDADHRPEMDLSGDMAVFVRATLRNPDTHQGLLEKSIGEAVNTAYSLFHDADKFIFRVHDGALKDVFSTTLPSAIQNQEFVLGGVKRGTNTELWLDGTKEGTTPNVGALSTGVGKLRIGGLFWGTYGFVGGDITEVLAFNFAPSPAEIGLIQNGIPLVFADPLTQIGVGTG